MLPLTVNTVSDWLPAPFMQLDERGKLLDNCTCMEEQHEWYAQLSSEQQKSPLVKDLWNWNLADHKTQS